MNNFVFLIYGIFWGFCLVCPHLQVRAAESDIQDRCPRVLFLSSYHEAFPTVRYQLDGVFELSKRVSEGVDIDVYMMDTKRFSPKQRAPFIYEDLEQLVEERGGYDLILSADDNALRFLVEYKDELFGVSIPVVFFGINDYQLGEKAALDLHYTGLIERTCLTETVETAFRILPGLEKLVVVVDSTPTGEGDIRAFYEQVPEEYLKKCTFENMKYSSFEEVGEQLAALGDNDAVFLLSAYFDKTGQRLDFPATLEWVRSHTSRPVFHPYRHGVGEGLIGGKVVSHYAMAKIAVDYAARILHGESAASLPLLRDEGNIYLFDYRDLTAAGADLSKLPEEAVLLNQPRSLWREYRQWIISLAIVGALILVFALTISILYVRKRQLFKALQESEYRMSNLFANSYAPMMVLSMGEDEIVDVNPAALRFYGYSREAFLELKWADLNPDANITKRKWRERTSSRHVVQGCHRLADGQIKEVEVTLTQISKHGDPHLFAIVHDRTERIRWEQDLLRSKEAAEHANKAKDEFLGVMSHELRTPLNPIIGFCSVLLETNEDPDLRHYLRIINRSAERMLHLVDNILRYVKLRGGKQEPKCRELSIDAFLREAFVEYEVSIDGNEVILEKTQVLGLEVPSSPRVLADPHILRQILDNLVDNARKYTQKGQVRIGCAITPDQDAANQVLCHFHVTDTGIGIADDRLGTLFEPFTQVDSSFTRQYEGAGLGLAIVKELVEALDGDIGVTSELMKGSRFWFTIPLKLADTQTAKTIPGLNGQKHWKFDKPIEVLLFEDNQDNAIYVQSCIQSFGGSTVWVMNGSAGLEKASAKTFDVVLMDLSMPGMSGFEAMELLLEEASNNRDTPIIVLTAHADDETRVRCMDVGARKVLTKPFSKGELFESLQANLTQKAH